MDTIDEFKKSFVNYKVVIKYFAYTDTNFREKIKHA